MGPSFTVSDTDSSVGKQHIVLKVDKSIFIYFKMTQNIHQVSVSSS